MKTKDWILVGCIFLFAIFIDQYSKILAQSMPETRMGVLHLILIHNHGAMLGMFSKLPAFLRIVSLSTSGFFIFSFYAFLQFIIPVRVFTLRVGLTLLVAGILGNVIDRSYYGFVVDFISFQFGTFHTPVWNVADMIQWVGYFLIMYSLFKDSKVLWPDQNFRNQFWINKQFQLKYALIFISSGVFISLICMVFSYTYLKITLAEFGVIGTEASKQYTEAYLYAFGILVLSFSIVLFSVAKFISHRVAGPVYAFERFLLDLIEKNNLDNSQEIKQLKLRAGDDFKHLEELAEKIQSKLSDQKKF